jgi:hypothetical protein
VQKSAIYAWATTICERADAKLLNEDSHVELKKTWPSEGEIARQLAGHANAAHGEPILWLIGVVDGEQVCGISETKDPGAWYEVVRSGFEGAAPDLRVVFVTWHDRQVCALLFETDNPPYVVKNASGKGPFQYEVSWRDGTLTRSARKHELLKILVPLQKLPEIELQEATLTAGTRDDRAEVRWLLTMKAYVTPPPGVQIDLPFHKTSFEIWLNGHHDVTVPLEEHVRISPRSSYEGSSIPRIAATSTEITLSGPGSIEIRCSGQSKRSQEVPDRATQQHIVGHVRPAHAEVARMFECDLLPSQDSNDFSVGKWVYPPHRVSEKTTPDFVINLPEPSYSPFAPLPKPEGW